MNICNNFYTYSGVKEINREIAWFERMYNCDICNSKVREYNLYSHLHEKHKLGIDDLNEINKIIK